ncbi:MAG: hypothetical protein ABSE20_06365 [Acetobacteraceae bacterium]|jgi:hypothetical protein
MVEAGLLLGPPTAVGVYFIMSLHSRRALSSTSKFVVTYIAIILVPAAVGLRFTAVSANVASVALIWPAWCFCCARGCGAKWRSVRVLSWFVAVPSVGLGYLVGTVGCLGVAFGVGDTVSTPTHIQYFETPDLVCEITEWGGAGTHEGTSTVLYRRWAAVPWLRYRVAESTDDWTGGEQGMSCADLAAKK